MQDYKVVICFVACEYFHIKDKRRYQYYQILPHIGQIKFQTKKEGFAVDLYVSVLFWKFPPERTS